MNGMGWNGMGWMLHLQEVGTIVCTTNHTAHIPTIQMSRREPQHALHSPFLFSQAFYNLFIDHGHFSAILHIILHLDLSFAHVLLMLSVVVHNRVSFYQVHGLWRLFAYEHPLFSVLDVRLACRHAPHSGGTYRDDMIQTLHRPWVSKNQVGRPLFGVCV
jgi:hypothetical protein